jgi:hypothetical protein
MKKLTALLLACMTFVCAAVSCGKEENKDNKTETTTSAETDKDSADKKSDDDKSDDEKEDDKDSEGSSDENINKEDQAEAEKVVKKFADATFGGDVEAMLSCLYPSDVVKSMKESGDMDDFAEAVGDPDELGELKDFSTSDCKKLDEKAFEGAQQYFTMYAQLMGAEAGDYKVTDGFSMKMKAKVEQDGETEDFDEDVIVVKLDGEGWMLLPMSEDDLLSMVGDEDADEDDMEKSETTEAAETTEETTKAN